MYCWCVGFWLNTDYIVTSTAISCDFPSVNNWHAIHLVIRWYVQFRSLGNYIQYMQSEQRFNLLMDLFIIRHQEIARLNENVFFS